MLISFWKEVLACFCCFYFDSNFQACENLPWTNEWGIEVLIHDSVAYVCSAMEVAFQVDKWDVYGDDGDRLVSCMSLGDNFAMDIEERNEES